MNISPRMLFDRTKNVAGVLRELNGMDVHVEMGGDFTKYHAYRAAQSDREHVYPMFDSTHSFIDGSNGFWVCGFSSDGNLVHTQAVRLFDMTGISLASHLDDHRHKYITPGTTPDPDNTFFVGPHALPAITGKVCYHGDFWFHARAFSGPRAISLLSRLLIETMIASWDPDFVFALVPKKLAEKGLGLWYGYPHCAPGAWMAPDQQLTDEDDLIWMDRHDMANLSERPVPASPMSADRRLRGASAPLAEVKHISLAGTESE